MDSGGYPVLVVGAALIGAAAAVFLAVQGVGAVAIDAAVGFCLAIWIAAWGNLRRGEQGRAPDGDGGRA